MPNVRADLRAPAISFGGTRSTRSPALSSAASRRRERLRQSSIAHSRSGASRSAKPSSFGYAAISSAATVMSASSRPVSASTAIRRCASACARRSRSRSTSLLPSDLKRTADGQHIVKAKAKLLLGHAGKPSDAAVTMTVSGQPQRRHARSESTRRAEACDRLRTPPNTKRPRAGRHDVQVRLSLWRIKRLHLVPSGRELGASGDARLSKEQWRRGSLRVSAAARISSIATARSATWSPAAASALGSRAPAVEGPRQHHISRARPRPARPTQARPLPETRQSGGRA